MSWETIRGMTGESFIEWCERNDYDLSSDSARRLLVEAKALLKEHDRAVELLQDAHSAFVYNNDTGVVELRCADKIAINIDEFLREMEGSDRDHERADGIGKIEENK